MKSEAEPIYKKINSDLFVKSLPEYSAHDSTQTNGAAISNAWDIQLILLKDEDKGFYV